METKQLKKRGTFVLVGLASYAFVVMGVVELHDEKHQVCALETIRETVVHNFAKKHKCDGDDGGGG